MSSTSINDPNAYQVERDLPLFASVLLAAGIGSRLRPLTDVIPKPGLPLLDVPLAVWGLADLKALGAPVIMNLSEHHEAVLAALGETADDVEMFLEPTPLGSAGTIAALRERFEGPIVTRNADLLSSLSSADVVNTHRRTGAPTTIAVQVVDSGADLVGSGSDLRLIDRRTVDVAGLRFLGLSVFERDALDLLETGGPRDLASGLLRHLIDRGMVATHVHDGYALDVGTPARYLTASLDLLAGVALRPPTPFPGKIVEVDGGRTYIGPGAAVEETSLGPGAIVLRGARVDQGARVTNAIVWLNERVPSDVDLEGAIWAFGQRIDPT